MPDNNIKQFFGFDVPAGLYRASDPAYPFGGGTPFTNSSVADGFYLLVAPLPPGDHVVEFGGSFGTPGTPGSFTLDIRYNLVVTPEPGTALLFAVGLAGGYWAWRRARRRTR